METMPNISMALLAIQHNNGDQQHMIIDVAPDGSIKVRKPFTIRFASGLSVDVIITLTITTASGHIAFASFAGDALGATKVLPAGGACDFPVTPCYFTPKSSSIPKEERNRCTIDVFINNVHVGSVPVKVFQKSTSFGNSLNIFYSFQLCPESILPSQLLFTFTNEKRQAGNPSSPFRQKVNARTSKKVANAPRNDRRSSLDSLPLLLPVAQRSTEAGMSTSPLPPSLTSAASPCSLFTPSAFFQASSSSSSSSNSSSPPPFPLQSPEDSQSLSGLDGNPWHSDEEMAFESLFSLSHEVLE